MQTDYVYNPNGISTYHEEQFECIDQQGNDKRFTRIEHSVINASSYIELAHNSNFEIKVIDKKTKLRELKCQKIRVIHFLDEDNIFVFLGTFIKKSRKTPKSEIDKNNKRIDKYMLRKGEEK